MLTVFIKMQESPEIAKFIFNLFSIPSPINELSVFYERDVFVWNALLFFFCFCFGWFTDLQILKSNKRLGKKKPNKKPNMSTNRNSTINTLSQWVHSTMGSKNNIEQQHKTNKTNNNTMPPKKRRTTQREAIESEAHAAHSNTTVITPGSKTISNTQLPFKHNTFQTQFTFEFRCTLPTRFSCPRTQSWSLVHRTL